MLNIYYYLSLALPILTTLWVAYDAAKNEITTDSQPYSARNGALVWALACVLLWIAAFPLYLIQRAKQLRVRRGSFIGGLAVAAWAALMLASAMHKLPLTTEDYRQVALKSLTETLAPKGVTVQGLTLEHKQGSDYQGVVSLSGRGHRQEIPVDVHVEDGQVRWQIRQSK